METEIQLKRQEILQIFEERKLTAKMVQPVKMRRLDKRILIAKSKTTATKETKEIVRKVQSWNQWEDNRRDPQMGSH